MSEPETSADAKPEGVDERADGAPDPHALDELLDEALEETFPASDPIAVSIQPAGGDAKDVAVGDTKDVAAGDTKDGAEGDTKDGAEGDTKDGAEGGAGSVDGASEDRKR